MPNNALSNFALFGKELFRNPKQIGAICPSSIFLARRMSDFLASDSSHSVVELGAGTGAITAGLLRTGLAPERLIVIEKSAELVGILRQRFPNLRIICGDAQELHALLERQLPTHSGRIGHVVSSIPLKLLSPDEVKGILHQVHRTLRPGGLYFQYTYAFWESQSQICGFQPHRTSMVWMNFPPARVDVFRRNGERAEAHSRQGRRGAKSRK